MEGLDAGVGRWPKDGQAECNFFMRDVGLERFSLRTIPPEELLGSDKDARGVAV